MSPIANVRSIKSAIRSSIKREKLNILTFATHERYEENLCKTGHNFYSLTIGKKWDTLYAKIPENYFIIDDIPEYVDFDLILAHTGCERAQIAHDILSSSKGSKYNVSGIPIIRHNHVLPDIRYDLSMQIQANKNPLYNVFSFISDYSMRQWGFSEGAVINHGIDEDFWNPGNEKRDNVCLSVVNDWVNRDWCCGWNLWKEIVGVSGGNGTKNNPLKVNLPVRVFGKNPGFSVAADSTEHLRKIYQKSRIFLNTSLHSPVPTVLLEAMACGCAVVSTANCMIPEVIEHGVNGLISNNPSELRSFVQMLLQDEKLAASLGKNAANTIKEKYNLKKFINNWNNLFYSTIENFRG